MFFKRRDWRPELVPELAGSYGNLTVRIRRFPCLVDPADGSRKFRYPDFGSEFIAELTDRLVGDRDDLRAELAGGGTRAVAVQLRGLAPIEIHLAGELPATDRELHSDLADAIIQALESAGIKP